VKRVAEALRVSRSTLIERLRPAEQRSRLRRRREPLDDETLRRAIGEVVDQRASYGYRRVTALLRQRAEPLIANHKRVYRLMRANGQLLQRFTGKSPRTHKGSIITLRSDTRWCSDSFEIRCWDGQRVQVVFALDCCDREVITWRATTAAITGELVRDLMAESVEARFGTIALRAATPVQWLSDNAPCYTAHETRAFGEELGLVVCTTPAYSPESNGMAESFVKSFKRDYVYVNRLETAETVLHDIAAWMNDYNEHHPHKGLKMRSPREFRRLTATC
jgi:transposase InsO family protein